MLLYYSSTGMSRSLLTVLSCFSGEVTNVRKQCTSAVLQGSTLYLYVLQGPTLYVLQGPTLYVLESTRDAHNNYYVLDTILFSFIHTLVVGWDFRGCLQRQENFGRNLQWVCRPSQICWGSYTDRLFRWESSNGTRNPRSLK